jgi:molecular chaperone DnaK
VNEPTAAVLAFNFDEVGQKVVVYDLGGGTFDVSIIEIKSGMYRVVATSGDNHLGGDDFDYKVAHWIKDQFRKVNGVALVYEPQQAALLREKAKKAKIDLTKKEETNVSFNNLRGIDGKRYNLNLTLNREILENLIQSLIDKTLDICDATLDMAKQKTGLLASDISQMLLVGGQTLTPAVHRAIHQKYGWMLNSSVDPGHAVALGASVLAGYLNKDPYLCKRIRLWDVVAQPLGIEIKKENQHEIQKRTMIEIIKANQQIPIRTERKPLEFTTNRDGQTRIEFRVYQGFNPIAKKNTHIGIVPITLTTPRPKGNARVKCWFEIDFDGILLVHVKELDTDAAEVLKKIDYYYYLSQEESERLE